MTGVGGPIQLARAAHPNLLTSARERTHFSAATSERHTFHELPRPLATRPLG